MNTYINLIADIKPNSFLHYWSVETTIEEFVQHHKEIGLFKSNKEKTKTDIEKEYPNPSLSRTLKENIPIDIKINTDLRILSLYRNCFKYPEGTTHFKVELYHADTFTHSYLSEHEIPVALKIIGDVNSTDSTWYTYKLVDGFEKWVELNKGTRGTDDIHSLEKIEKFEQSVLETEPYIIDLVSEKLEKSSINRLLLELYSPSLSDLFDEKHSYEKLVNYFKLNRVYPITIIDDKTYYVDEVEDQNINNTKLNEMFYNVVIDNKFKEAYNEVLINE